MTNTTSDNEKPESRPLEPDNGGNILIAIIAVVVTVVIIFLGVPIISALRVG